MVLRDRIPIPTLFGIATAFGVSSSLQAVGMQQLRGVGADAFLTLLVLNLAYWYVPALAAPLILEAAARLRSRSWPAQAFSHATAALAYAVVHTAIMLVCKAVIVPARHAIGGPEWWTRAGHEFLMQLDWLLMTYLFFVGLAYAFAYRRQSESAAINAAALETRLVEARLQALQRQLHPHFLFNTLNTIGGLLHVDPQAADRMVDRLGDLLRMTLDASVAQEVPLQEELEVVEKYLEIEQTRFGDRLHVTLDVAPDTLDVLVPNLLLQPLVENAIRHGVAPKARPGWIEIRARRAGARLRLEVCDSGDGVAPERLSALNGGVGLQNTRERLEHLYPGRHQLVFSNLERGFSVTVAIPFTVTPIAALGRPA
jgi:signal transduction histidine kinase